MNTPIPKLNRYYIVHKEPVLLTEQHLKNSSIDVPHPIKLTKPWLLAFGFQSDPVDYSWRFEDARLVAGMNCWLCVKSRRYIQYVHELQDLFEEHFHETELVLTSRSFYV